MESTDAKFRGFYNGEFWKHSERNLEVDSIARIYQEGDTMVEDRSLDALEGINLNLRENSFAVAKDALTSDESLIWAGDIGQLGGNSQIRFGYLLITDHRFIRVLFNAEVEGMGCVGALLGLVSWGLLAPTGKPKREHLELDNHAEVDHVRNMSRFVVVPPNSPLSQIEIESRRIDEYSLSDLSNFEQKEYRQWSGDNTVADLSLRFKSSGKVSVIFFSQEVAQEVYGLLVKSSQSAGRSRKQSESIADQLEKLAELYKYQTITEDEYEAAKKRLIGSR